MANKKATEDQFNELHNLVTKEFLARIKSGEATTQDLKAACDWLKTNDISGVAYDGNPLSKLAQVCQRLILNWYNRTLWLSSPVAPQLTTPVTADPYWSSVLTSANTTKKKEVKRRVELKRINRQKGTYGNGDGKDVSHKKDGTVFMEKASKTVHETVVVNDPFASYT